MRQILFLVLLVSIIFTGFTVPTVSRAAGLVVCALNADDPVTEFNETAPCTACHVLYMAKIIIDWIIKVMTVIGIAVIFAMGILYIVSVGNEKILSTAKGGIKAALIGITVILCAWLIVNTIIRISGSSGYFSGYFQNGTFSFTCDPNSTAGSASSTNFGAAGTISKKQISKILTPTKGSRNSLGPLRASEPAPLGVSGSNPLASAQQTLQNESLSEGLVILQRHASDPKVTMETAYVFLENNSGWRLLGTGDRTSVDMSSVEGYIEYAYANNQPGPLYLVHTHPYDLARYKPVPPSGADVFSAALIAAAYPNGPKVEHLAVETRGVWKYGVSNKAAADRIVSEWNEATSQGIINEIASNPVLVKDLNQLSGVSSASGSGMAAVQQIVIERALGGEYGIGTQKQFQQIYGNTIPKNFLLGMSAMEYHYYRGDVSLQEYINFYSSYGASIIPPQ